jgi:hypothetical protein
MVTSRDAGSLPADKFAPDIFSTTVGTLGGPESFSMVDPYSPRADRARVGKLEK